MLIPPPAETAGGRSLTRVTEQLVYLDHAATTPMRQVAIDAMLPFLADGYANPSGAHRFARHARRAVDDARDVVAEVVGCLPGEVVFTSGGTESDNAAISGAVWRHGGVPVCPATEHHGVLNVVERHTGRVAGVDRYGRVDLEQLAAAIDEHVSIVSVMAVNNEVGSINDLDAVAAVVRGAAPNALLHTDAVQAACWLDLRQLWPHVDLLSLSAHKFGGPKGVGVLVIRKGVTIDPLLVGGGQERDRRSGTHNVPGIVAMAAALAATDAERETECVRVAALRDRLVGGLVSAVDGVHETVPTDIKVAGGAHICVEGVESESLLFLLDEEGLCASAASACASGAMEPSHVLAAMGVQGNWSTGALRMTLGRTTTADDADRAVEILAGAISTLRARSAPVAHAAGRP
jgi:cysteine desulfurase